MSQNSEVPEDVTQESSFRSQFDVLTPGLRSWAGKISREVFELRPLDLEEKIKPTVLERRLKKRFWQEYQRVIGLGLEELAPFSVYSGLCSKQFFYKRIVEDAEVFAWILSPLNEFDLMSEEALEFAIERIRAEILTAPLYDRNGKFDVAVSAQVLSAAKFLDARVKGSPLQRIEQKSLHLHKNADAPKGITREELDMELEALRERAAGPQMLLTIKAPSDTE